VAISTGQESGIFVLEEDEEDAIKAQSWHTTPTPIVKTGISAKTGKPVESRSWWRSGNYTNRLRAIRMQASIGSEGCGVLAVALILPSHRLPPG